MQLQFKFISLLHQNKEIYTVNSTDKIFDLIKQLYDLYAPSCFRFIKTQKYFGYDYHLNNTFDDYLNDFDQQINIICMHSSLDHIPTNKLISFAIYSYINNKPYPPCDNFKEDEPLNLGPIGSWTGWGRGPTRVDKTDDNTINNIVVIEYPDGRRTGFNKFMLYESIISDKEMRDPFTRYQYDVNFINKLTSICQQYLPFQEIKLENKIMYNVVNTI